VDGKPEHPESGEERCIGLDSKGIPYITYFAQKFYDKQQIRIASIIPPKPDSDDDGDVDWSDLKAMVDDWLWSGHPGDSPGDTSCDGMVRFDDFALLAGRWLEGFYAQAHDPSPVGWKPGSLATWHEVYVGSNFNDVNDAADPNTPPGQGRQDANTYDSPGLLDLGKTYHWRIDEVGSETWKGDVWNFTVKDQLVLDNMENYNGNTLYDTWKDGWDNGTCAAIWLGSVLRVPPDPVHGGLQSMAYMYDNVASEPYYSEAFRTLSEPRDWRQLRQRD
jgi:hypothetical protein